MKWNFNEVILVFILVLLALGFNSLELRKDVSDYIKKNSRARFLIIWASTYTIFYLDMHTHYKHFSRLTVSFIVSAIIYSITQ